jgi:hypothetical protein|nr:MAG TPA: hypothetical protein [Caudoviricetes sp.]
MAKTKIKYITFAPKVESTWNTPEEKQTEKARVIADASEKMVTSLIARNKKSKTMDYRGIYYNGKLGLILVCKKLPDDAVATNYAQYVVKFDLDAATGGGTIDETTINNLIKKFLENNPIEDKDTKEYILDRDITSTKIAFEKFKDLADKNGSFVNYGSVDDFEATYPGLLTIYGVTLDTGDTLKMANYKVHYGYDKDTNEVMFTLKISGITSKGKMLTTTIRGNGEHTDAAPNITKVDQHLYDLGQPGTVQPATPAKYVELDKLKTPKGIFESLDSLKTNGKYKTSGTINDEAKIKQIVNQFNLDPFLGDMAGKDDSYTRITWDIEYSKPSDTDPITSELNIHVESHKGRRALVKIAYNNAPATQDDTTGKVVSGGLLPVLIRPPFDPAFKGAFAPSNLRQMIKDYVVEEHEYPVELSGVVLDNRVMNDAKQYYTETNTAVVDPVALMYEIKIELTGANYFTGKVKLTWILENGKKVLLSGEYENASAGLATPGNYLQNRVVRVIEPVTGGGGTPTESKQIMDYKHTYYTSPTPLEVTTRFKDFVKTNTNTAYLEGTVVKKEDLDTFAPLLNQVVTEGDKDAVAMLYEITYVKETGNAVTYNETMHFILKDGRQVKVVRTHSNQSLNTPATTTSEIIPVGVSKEIKEKIIELEKTDKTIKEKLEILEKETKKHSTLNFEKRTIYGDQGDIVLSQQPLPESGYKSHYFFNFKKNLANFDVEDTTQNTFIYFDGEKGITLERYSNLLDMTPSLHKRLYQRLMQDFTGVNNVYKKNSWVMEGATSEVVETLILPKASLYAKLSRSSGPTGEQKNLTRIPTWYFIIYKPEEHSAFHNEEEFNRFRDSTPKTMYLNFAWILSTSYTLSADTLTFPVGIKGTSHSHSLEAELITSLGSNITIARVTIKDQETWKKLLYAAICTEGSIATPITYDLRHGTGGKVTIKPRDEMRFHSVIGDLGTNVMKPAWSFTSLSDLYLNNSLKNIYHESLGCKPTLCLKENPYGTEMTLMGDFFTGGFIAQDIKTTGAHTNKELIISVAESRGDKKYKLEMGTNRTLSYEEKPEYNETYSPVVDVKIPFTATNVTDSTPGKVLDGTVKYSLDVLTDKGIQGPVGLGG